LSYDDEWQNYIESGAGVMQDVRSRLNDAEDSSNPLEATISRTKSLMDHLRWQLDMSNFDHRDYEIAEFLIGNIDDEGYLSISLRELLATTPSLKELVDLILDDEDIEVQNSGHPNEMYDLAHEAASNILHHSSA